MSFDAIETAIDLGQPIRLYKFFRGTMVWAYCTADRDTTYGSQVYRSVNISDSGIRSTGQAQADTLEITAPADIDVAKLYRGISPSAAIEIVIYDLHAGDYSDAVIRYVGSIQGVQFPAEDRCKINCNTDEAGLNQMGLRLTWGKGCPYTLYERGCDVNRDLFKLETTIQDMDGASIGSGDFDLEADGWFNGGYIEWSVGSGQYDRRGIVSHIDSVLELLGGTDGLALNMEVTAFPGCNRTIQTCNDKFDNRINFGGQPHQPGKSPFDGDPFF
jgi:uncharacterized phage protein (TIGR02218 family)